MVERTSVVVIGAGITGVALGYHLAGKGTSHIVLEATDRPGGVIRSGYVEGKLLEWGPQRTRRTAGVNEIVTSLGLEDATITAPPGLPLFVYRAGRLRRVPFSALEFITSDIASLRGRLRALREPFTGPARPDESVATYFTRKLGSELYENLAGPLYGGLYASDPTDMVVDLSLGHVLRELRVGRSLLLTLLGRGGSVSPPGILSFAEGMEVLPRTLAAANQANIRLSSAAHTIHRERNRWMVEWEGGSILSDHVVITTPAPAAGRLLERADPQAAQAISSLHYNPLAVVHLDASTDLHGLGFQVSLAERLATRGVTFNDSLFGRTGVYTAYLGGARAPEVVRWRDEEISGVAVREFRSITGWEARPLHVDREKMPAWDSSWSALTDLSLPRGVHLAANWQSRPGIAGRLAQAKKLAAELSASVHG